MKEINSYIKGNANLVYTIIRKRQVFYQLANLSSDSAFIQQALKNRKNKPPAEPIEKVPESPKPVLKEENDTIQLQSTLAATPQITAMTDKGPGLDINTDKVGSNEEWHPSPEWVEAWKSKLPLQTIMRLLQVLVPQVEKICIDK